MAFENLLLYRYGGYLAVWKNTRQTITLIFRQLCIVPSKGGRWRYEKFPKDPLR
jgi:hypothetical protein